MLPPDLPAPAQTPSIHLPRCRSMGQQPDVRRKGPGAWPPEDHPWPRGTATATMDTSSGLLLKGRPRGSFLGMESRALEAQWLISPWQGCTLSHPSRSRAPRSRIHRGARGKARH